MNSSPNLGSCWPHRLAVVLVCATFPLIWVGGLVTTYDAGMAVPDWPTTYGYNLFLYPYTTWVAGPWDLFIEHGHRLLGALTGLITIALVAVVWRYDDRLWLRWLSVGALVLVVFQGLLGGARVIQDERQLAKIHGCVGPAFFALATALAVVTSRWWQSDANVSGETSTGKLRRLALLTTALAYVQLILGANLRHVPVTAEASEFRAAVVFHLLGAAAVAIHVLVLATHVLRRFPSQPILWRPTALLALLIVLQVALGLTAWVVNYGTPFESESLRTSFAVEAQGMLQALTVTAHAASGSLILALLVVLALRAFRLAPGGTESPTSQSFRHSSRGLRATA